MFNLKILLLMQYCLAQVLIQLKLICKKSIDLLEDLGAEPDILEEFRTKTLETATKENIVYKFNTSNLKEKERMLLSMETKPVAGMTLLATQNLKNF